MAEYTPIKPKKIEVKDIDGEIHEYWISRFPATKGREILAKYPVSNIPKLGQYLQSEEAMLTLMQYVAVELFAGTPDARMQPFTTAALIDNHVPDGQTLLKIEFEMLRYNTDFFGIVGSSGFVEGLVKKYLPSIIQILTETLAPSSAPDSPRSGNSKLSTTSKTP